MNAAIQDRYLYRSQSHLSLYPVGQGDQAIINNMKLGTRRRSHNKPVSLPLWASEAPTLATAS